MGATVVLAIVLNVSMSTAAESSPRHAPQQEETPSSRPVWPIVVGALLLVPAYGLSVYDAALGSAGEYGQWTFGDKGWLYVPVVGPFVFAGTVCSEAKDYFDEHPRTDEPDAACDSTAGWMLVGVTQLIGATFLGVGLFAPSPSETTTKRPPAAKIWIAPRLSAEGMGIVAIGSL